MVQPRIKVQQALRAVLGASSAEDRAAAGEVLQTQLKAYLSAEDATPSEGGLGALNRTRRVLGEYQAPISRLSEEELRSFNCLLPWASLTVDQKGRLVGAASSQDKRNRAHALVDPRQISFNEEYPLSGRDVLELGCFEGAQTLGLLFLGARVTAVDSRVENVLKTMARLWAYGKSCEIVHWDVECAPPAGLLGEWDVLHHVGVLYHLADPVGHLHTVLPRTRSAMLLDTHIATDEAQTDRDYTVNGRVYRFRHKPEPSASFSPFAGMKDHAKYLLLEDLLDLVRTQGFSDVRVVSDREERNGRRVTVWAFRGA